MKLGLGHSYDRVEYLPRKLRAYIDLTKPASSVGVGMGYFLASLFYFYYGGHVHMIPEKLSSIIYVSVTVLFAHSASQAMNMAEDAEMDMLTEHKKDRPIPSGMVSEEEARSIAWILSAFALGRSYLVSWDFGVFVTILIFMGVFYNLDPIRAKERAISIPWQAVSRGLFLFPAVWAAYDTAVDPVPWTLGLFMFFYVLGFQNSADIMDRKVDKEFGIKTFVVMFGVRKTVLISLACTGAMLTVLIASVLLGVLPYRMYSLIVVIPFALYMTRSMWENPYIVSETTGNHPAWLWFYMGMVLIVAVPLVVEIIHATQV